MPQPRFLAGAMAVVVLAAAAVLGIAPAASAHDQLVSSSPAEGERLTEAPTSITLSYSADILPVGAEVIVIDGDDRDWTAGDPIMTESTVDVALATGMPDAGYEVRWRVVSSDGHPISGIIPFTIGEGTPLVREGSEASKASSAPDAESAAPSTSGDSDAGDLPRLVLIAAGGAAAALVLYLGVRFARRRSSHTSPETPAVRNGDNS